MKKILLTIMLVLMSAGVAFATGTVTCTSEYAENGMAIHTVSWTGSSSGGSVPATNIFAAGCNQTKGYIVMVVTDPGSTAPTANYDITLVDANGIDVMGGTLADRHTSNTEQAVPLVSGTNWPRFIYSTLTFTLTNNSVNSATGVAKIYVQR